MTNETQTLNQAPANAQSDGAKKPTHIAKVKEGFGKNVSFEQVGVAWDNGDGKLAIQLYGTQMISGKIYLNKYQDTDLS